jgi:hypothetical protein
MGSIENIATISAMCSLNDCINKFNKCIDSYNAICDPMEEHATACLKACKLEKTGAVAKHVFLGCCLAVACEKDCTVDDLKGEIEILDYDPWCKFGKRFEKMDGLIENLPAWVCCYMTAPV